MNKLVERFNIAKVAFGTALMTGAVVVQAAIPDTVKTEITSAKSDVTETIGLILGVLVLGFGFRMIKRFF